jgi:uncharacterized protein
MAESNQLLGTEEQPLVPPTSDEKTMAMLSHILTLVAGFIPPLVIWLVKKDESKFVSDNAKESLNFIITLAIGYCIAFVLMFILIGMFLIFVLWIAQLVLVIIATIKTNEGKVYRYPINLRLIK